VPRMRDNHKTKEQLIQENTELRQRIAELEQWEIDHKQAEESRRESEERYRTLVDNIDLGINLMDTDHNVLMVNAFMGKIFNKPVSDLVGKKCFREFEKRDAVCPHCPGVQAMATGKPAEVETKGVRDDGSRFDVRIQTFPVFGQDGTATAFIEIAEDITERKRVEEALRESEREASHYPRGHSRGILRSRPCRKPYLL